MGGHHFDKKGEYKKEKLAQSGQSLSNALRQNLRGSIILHRLHKDGVDYSLYVPEDTYKQVLTGLQHQYPEEEFKGTEMHVYNGNDVEIRFKIDLSSKCGVPILDALKSKQVPFTVARELTGQDDFDEAIQQVAIGLAGRGGGI